MKKILLSLCLATTGMAYSQLITDGLFAYFPFDSTFSDQGPNHLTSHVDVPIYSADKNGTLNKVFVIDSLKNVFHINAQQQMKDLIKSPYSISFWYYFEDPSLFYDLSLKISKHVYDAAIIKPLNNEKGKWTHCVIQSSGGSDGFFKLYINSNLINGTTSSLKNINAHNSDSTTSKIMNYYFNYEVNAPYATKNANNVKLDDLIFYNRSLTVPEIQMIFNDKITAIDSQQTNTVKTLLKTYNLQGQEITKDSKGVQIRVFSDGSREKVFVE